MCIFNKHSLLTIGLVSLLLVVTLAAGCSGTSTTSPTIPQTPPVELNVSAAASLTDALKAVNDAYIKDNPNVTVVANFAASGTLQKQIEQGAPTDVFISAAAKQMDSLQKESLIINDTRQDLLNNKIVLVVPTNNALNISKFQDLTDARVTKIAIGDPESVPAGTYGMQALDTLGISASLKSKLILCSDVRQVLTYVQSGDVDAGIVYSTDAATTDKVKVVDNAPDSINALIVYPVAVIKTSKNVDAAKAYIAFLFSDKAKAIFEKYGFSMVKK